VGIKLDCIISITNYTLVTTEIWKYLNMDVPLKKQHK